MTDQKRATARIPHDSPPAGLDTLTGTENLAVSAGTGLDRRVEWSLVAADIAAITAVVWGAVTGEVPTLLDSSRWPHLAWLLAGATGLALLMGVGEDIRRCYRTTRRVHDHEPRATATAAATPEEVS